MASRLSRLLATDETAVAPSRLSRLLGGASPGEPESRLERLLGTPDPQRTATTFERVLDALATPGQATAGAVRGLIREGPGGIVEGARRGMAEDTDFGDILREDAGLPALPSALLGFGADVVVDPLNLVGGLGFATKAGRAAKAAKIGLEAAELSGDARRIVDAGKAVAETGDLGATLAQQGRKGQRSLLTVAGRNVVPAPVNEAVLGAVDAAGRTFGATRPVQEARKAVMAIPSLAGTARELFLSRASGVRGEAAQATQDAAKALQPHAQDVYRLARTHGIDARTIQRAVTEAVEKAAPQVGEDVPAAILRATDTALSAFDAGARSDLAPVVRDAVGAINAQNAAGLAATRGAGVTIAELDDEAINYLRRVMRPEARDLIRDLGSGDVDRGLSRLITEKHGAQNQRSFKGLTIPEINDLAESGKLSLLGNKPLKGGLFVEDPFLATVTRAGEAGKAVASAKLLKDYARVHGAPVKKVRRGGKLVRQVPKGWRTVNNLVAGVGKDVAFPPDVATALETHFERIVEPGFLLRQWDTANRLWSRHTVGIVPVTEFRNMVGDVWNGVVLGGMNPLKVADAASAMAFGTKQGAALGLTQDTIHRLPGGRVLSGTELKGLATRHGVMQATEMSQLLDDLGTLEQPASGLAERLGRAGASVIAPKWQARVARLREQGTRLAFFLDRLEKGDAPEVAAITVKKYLFDYGELTAFERQVLKRAMPFYTWMRNNVPLQVGHLFAKPQAFAGVQKARTEAAGSEPLGLEDAEMPRFMREGLPLRAGENEEGMPQFMRLAGYLPAADIGNFADPGQAMQTLVNSLSPFITQPLESAANVNLFRSDLSSGRFEPQERFRGETESMLGIPMNKRWVRAPLENVRAISELDRANPFGIFGDEESGPLGVPRSRPDADPLARILSLILGRTYALDPETERMRSENREDREVSRLRSELRRALGRDDLVNADAIERLLQELEDSQLADR